MATIDGPKYTGPLTLDLTNVKDHLIDLPPGAMKGIRGEQPGMQDVIDELATAVPAHGNAADVPLPAYQRFVQRTALLAQLRTHEAALVKALEICTETRAKTENDREDDISVIVKAVQGAVTRTKDPGVAAPFEKTIAYNGQIAEKALQTRKKNAELKAEPPAGDDGQPA